MSFTDREIIEESGPRYEPNIRGVLRHMHDNLEGIRDELDLLHLTGTLPQRSFENMVRKVEELRDLVAVIAVSTD